MATTLYWLQCGGCAGDTMSLCNLESPDLLQLLDILEIDVLWHPSLSDNTPSQHLKLVEAMLSGQQTFCHAPNRESFLTNVAKYGAEKTEATLSVTQDADWVTFCVRNHGAGFRPEDQAALFHKFSRLRNENTANKRGSGLGLFLVKYILELKWRRRPRRIRTGAVGRILFPVPDTVKGKFMPYWASDLIILWTPINWEQSEKWGERSPEK